MARKSPWLTIWIHPRNTIRRIVAENPNKNLWLLAIVYGFSSLLGTFQSFSLGSHFSVVAIVLAALIFAIVWGYIIFSIWGWLITWTGKILKGAGDFRDIRASFAWSNVPMVVTDIVWIVTLITFGAKVFISPGFDNQMLNGASYAILVFSLIRVVMSIWSLVICVSALAEVQRFSVIRAIGNLILAGILIAIIAGIVSYLIMLLIGNPSQSTATLFFNY